MALKERNLKKEEITLRLLVQAYPNIFFGKAELDSMPFMRIPSVNLVLLPFLSLDTWKEIKRKIEKIIETTNHCKICYEENDFYIICPHCVEFYCLHCSYRIAPTCAICQQDLNTYMV
jgi:hypothetical protein